MTPVSPFTDRTIAQRDAALARANEHRIKRARMKRDLKEGVVGAEWILLYPPDHALTMKVFALLMAVPKLGRVKARRILNGCRISQSKTVGGLSDRQRGEIVRLLGGTR